MTEANSTNNQAQNALNDFLRDRKERFLSNLDSGESGAQEWTVVTGNEAGDLDSVASAIGYAYLLSDSCIIPMIQTPRDSLHLRPENELAFATAFVDQSFLLTPSDIPSSSRKLTPKLVLVDHNRRLPSLTGEVIGILDHHEDENHHLDAQPRKIEPVGSCSSLVTTHFAEVWKSGPPDRFRSVALLLLSAILIDTSGLKPGGKATITDHEAARLLIPLTGLATESSIAGSTSQVPIAVNDLSRKLAVSKSSVEHLSPRDLLRRDYKEYTINDLKVGLSTVPLGLKYLVKRNSDQLWDDIDTWMSEQKLDILGILTSYTSSKRKKHRRQLLFVVQPGHPDAEEKIFTTIASDTDLRCEERAIAGAGKRRARCWQQGNVKATRKVVAPLVRKALEG
ncbi:DHH phosphoesterase [Serendipita vermifera]|nr:DHH phosphoesterase [Serendipita vermifera]